MILGSALVAGLFLSPPAPSRGNWAAGIALRPEIASKGDGLGFQSIFRWRFARNFGLDTVGRSTLSTARDPGIPDQFYLALGAGVAWFEREYVNQWSWRAAARLTHVHHAPRESWEDTPGLNLAGDSGGGVQHRSGAELAVGVTAPSLTRLWGESLRWEVELQAGALPSSTHFEWTGGLALALIIDAVEE